MNLGIILTRAPLGVGVSVFKFQPTDKIYLSTSDCQAARGGRMWGNATAAEALERGRKARYHLHIGGGARDAAAVLPAAREAE